MIYDLVVIGGGAAGSHAALNAAAHGFKQVLLIEAGFLGGTCLNAGCIPTKFLLGSTAALPLLHAQQKLRSIEGEISFKLDGIQERKNRYIKGSRSALEKRLKDVGVEYLKGTASFTSGESLKVKIPGSDDIVIQFTKCIVATGSVPASFPNVAPDGKNVISSSSALNLAAAPESLIIIGGGVIGIELGEFYSRLGSKIIVVEALDRIVASEDKEISAALQKQLTREGWAFYTGKRVAEVKSTEQGVSLLFDDGELLHAAKAMVAVGRRPGIKNLDAEKAGLSLAGPGWVKTDEFLLAAPGIYAVGDINSKILLAHAAEHQAEYAVRHAAGKTTAPYSVEAMPSCIYGHYETMQVGPHAEALAQSYKNETVEVSKSQLIANPISQSYGVTQGFVKITWVNGKVYSICAWGHGVSHLIGLATIVVQEHWDEAKIIFAHPTLDEAIKSALLAPKSSILN